MKELLHLDERPASWKVLLDCPHDAKICVIGVSRATDLALRRSFGMLDAGLVLNRQYDVVIVGSRVDMRHVKPDALIAATASHGTIVELWQTALARCLIDAGFTSRRCYLGLPGKEPRLFIPLASRRLRNRGLTFHTPGSFRARLGLRLVKALSSLGWAGYLGPCTVTFYARRIATSQAVSFRLWLSERLGYEILDLAVYAGSNGPRRKITALAIADNAREDVVVKIADTQLGSEAITQESEALLTLARSDLSCQVPYVITEDKWNGYHVQVQQAVSRGQSRQEPHLSDAHLRFLAGLSQLGHRVVPLRQTRTWQKIRLWASSVSPRQIAGPIRPVLQRVLSSQFADRTVICHRTHGDFAPWNVKMHDGGLVVYDWEDSVPDGLALTDAFHFLFRQASLVGPWPGGQRVVEASQSHVSVLRRHLGLSGEIAELLLSVWALGQYVDRLSLHMEEVIGAIVSREQTS